MADVPGGKGCTHALELVSAITGYVVTSGRRLGRDVLRKSVEETLFLCTGPDPLFDRSEFEVRLTHFLRKHGISAMLRILLSLHLFNVVWIQTEKSFRMLAGTERSFQKYMRQVEQTCRRIVREAWRSQNARSPSKKLIETIEERVWDA